VFPPLRFIIFSYASELVNSFWLTGVRPQANFRSYCQERGGEWAALAQDALRRRENLETVAADTRDKRDPAASATRTASAVGPETAAMTGARNLLSEPKIVAELAKATLPPA
jgi:hypothetical protein